MSPYPSDHPFEIEIVVASHGEDLRWIHRLPGNVRVILYEKSEDKPFLEGLGKNRRSPGRKTLLPEIIALPNIGREAHTYLTHLVQRYDSLAEMTVFCQGHPFDHAPDFHQVVRELAESQGRSVSYQKDFSWLGFIDDTDDLWGRRLFRKWTKNRDGRELHFVEFYKQLFGKTGETVPPLIHFRVGGQFVVRRAAVHQRPKVFYEKALELSGSFPDAAHCFERVWDRCFGAPAIDGATLDENGTRYHKKVRRLMVG